MSLTMSDYVVLQLVYDYINTTKVKAVTYDSLTSFAKKYKKTNYKVETIQRSLRKLASNGFFERRYVISRTTESRIVLYIPTRKFHEFFKVKQ